MTMLVEYSKCWYKVKVYPKFEYKVMVELYSEYVLVESDHCGTITQIWVESNVGVFCIYW